MLPRLTFNPGLALTGLRTTRPDLSLISYSEAIEDLLMDLKDTHFTYNVNKNTISEVFQMG